MNRYIFSLMMAVMLWPSSLFADGKDEEPRLTNISAAEDSLITKFSIGDTITFNTSFDSICGGFRERIIESGTKSIMYEAFNSVKNEKGEWVLKFYEDVILQKDHTYTLEIEGHEVADSKSKVVGKVSVIYRGDGEKPQDFVDDYEYSNIQYMSFTKKDGEELNNYRANFVAIQFSGEVKIVTEKCKIFDGAGNEHDFETINRLDNLQGCWYQFDIPMQLMLQSTDSLILHIYATDMAGRAVKGNLKKGEYDAKGGNDHYVLRYKCELGYPVLTISPKEGSYMSLKDFTFSNNQGIELLNEDYKIQLLASDNKVVASFSAGDLKNSENNLSFSYSLNEAIELVGSYSLVVPEGTFAIGAKKLGNKEMSVAYDISNKLQMYGLESMVPNDGSKVESLSKFVITFKENAVPEYFNTRKINLTNDEGSLITYAKAITDENRENDRQCIIVLDNPVTEPGNYHLNVPANAFALGLWGDHLSKEMTFDYEVTGLPDLALDYLVNTFVDSDKKLGKIEIIFPSFGYVDMVDSWDNPYRDVKLTDLSNKEIATGQLKLGGNQNQLIVESIKTVDSMKDELGEKLGAGKYNLHVPGGILIFVNEIYEKELVFEIDFDPAYGVSVKTKEDNNHKLESVDLVFLNYGVVDLKDSRTVPSYDVTMTDSENNVIATAQISIGRQQNNLLIVDNIRPADSKYEKLGVGNYWLHVPAGIMILDNETYEKEFVLEIAFYPSFDVDIKCYSDANKKLEKVELTFPSFEVVDMKESSTVSITDSQDNLVATAHLNKGNQQNRLYFDNIRTIDSQNENLAVGTYWLYVPAGVMIFDGMTYKKEFLLEINYIIDAIDGSFANTSKANGRVRVYNAQGMLSRDEKDSETALRGLDPGLYIINGQKVLIK